MDIDEEGAPQLATPKALDSGRRIAFQEEFQEGASPLPRSFDRGHFAPAENHQPKEGGDIFWTRGLDGSLRSECILDGTVFRDDEPGQASGEPGDAALHPLAERKNEAPVTGPGLKTNPRFQPTEPRRRPTKAPSIMSLPTKPT